MLKLTSWQHRGCSGSFLRLHENSFNNFRQNIPQELLVFGGQCSDCFSLLTDRKLSKPLPPPPISGTDGESLSSGIVWTLRFRNRALDRRPWVTERGSLTTCFTDLNGNSYWCWHLRDFHWFKTHTEMSSELSHNIQYCWTQVCSQKICVTSLAISTLFWSDCFELRAYTNDFETNIHAESPSALKHSESIVNKFFLVRNNNDQYLYHATCQQTSLNVHQLILSFVANAWFAYMIALRPSDNAFYWKCTYFCVSVPWAWDQLTCSSTWLIEEIAKL